MTVFLQLFLTTLTFLPLWIGNREFAKEYIPISLLSNDVLIGTPIVLGQDDGAYPFVVQNNQIHYVYESTLDYPCNYLISGTVHDLNDEPFTDFIVNIKMIETEDVIESAPIGHQFPGDSSLIENDASAWASLLVSWTVDYEIWLTDKIDGRDLSPHIIVETKGCDHNLAIVNFVQVKPLP